MAKKHLWLPATAVAVALTLVGGVAVASALHKNDIVVTVDGVAEPMSVREDTVGEVLEFDGITLGEHDVVLPSVDTRVTDGMEITVMYGRELTLTVDGEQRTIWTTARTVEEALAFLNLDDPLSKLSTSRSTAIGREGITLDVATPKDVTIDVAGTPVTLTVAGTVDDALKAAEVTVDDDDLVSPAADTVLSDGLAIVYTQVEQREVGEEVVIPFEKVEEETDSLDKGTTKVDTKGVDGLMNQVRLEVYHNGTLVSNDVVREEIITEAVNQVTLVGTRPVSGPDLSPAVGDSCKASYYWQGQMTANGEVFNPSDLTAAHKTLPFGTRVKVTNPSNGQTVVVRINDRGPYIAGRCLDLSKAAMEAIGGTSAGVITVTYEVL